MRENVKAALLSGLVLPGAGQIYGGRKLKGGIMILLVTVLLIAAVFIMVSIARDFMQAAAISDAADEATVAAILRGRVIAFLWLGASFLCLWIYGVVDALLDTGKRERTGDGESGSQISSDHD